MAAPTTLTVVNGGINRLRTKGGADKNSLFDLLNGYVTSTGTVKVRNGTKRNANIGQYSGAGRTKGLVAYQDQFHVFSDSVVDVPPGYALHVLNHPASEQLVASGTSVSTAVTPSAALSPAPQLLLNFDGANGATSTTDTSGNGHAMIMNASHASLTTSNPKFGTASLALPSFNPLGTYALYTDMVLGSGLDVLSQTEWTIECWFMVTSTLGPTSVAILWDYGGSIFNSLSDPSRFLLTVTDQGSGVYRVELNNGDMYPGTTGQTISQDYSISLNTWHHVAAVSHSGIVKVYMDGAAMTTTKALWTPPNYLNANANPSVIFGSLVTASINTLSVQEDAFASWDTAKYTANFTPPTAPYDSPVFPYSENWGQSLGYGYADDLTVPTAPLIVNGAATVTDLNGATLVAVGVTTGVGYGTPASPIITVAMAGVVPQNFFGAVIITPTGGTPQTLAALDADYNLALPGGSAPDGISTWTWAVPTATDYFVPGAASAVEFTTVGAPIFTPIPIKEIHFAAPYLGGLYVVAEFDVDSTVRAQYGDTYHYWVQSSTNKDSSNAWQADHNYLIGDVIIPTMPNGLTYIASRRDPANPTWTPNTAEVVGNVIEPTIYNGFKFTATATAGANPTTGETEPTWPTSDGAIVNENSLLANDQTITLAQPAPTTPVPTVPSRYTGGIAGGFGTSTGGA